jgi:glutathione S-transferase
MRLYFSPGACSLSPHIVLRELGMDFQPVKVDLGSKKTEEGKDYKAVNPNGYVPALQLEDGRVLTEGPAIVQFLADKKPEAKLAPAAGTFERAKLQEWLNFIGTEVHKTASTLWNPSITPEVRAGAKEKLAVRLGRVDQVLATQPFLLGEQYSVADTYLFVILSWSNHLQVDLTPFKHVQAFQGRVGGRPAVQAALKAEGLLK